MDNISDLDWNTFQIVEFQNAISDLERMKNSRAVIILPPDSED